MGKRVIDLSKGEVKIERRKKQVHAIGLLHPDGIGTKAVLVSKYEYYLINPDGTEKSLSHISKPGTDYAYLHDILPVKNNDSWVAFWLEEGAVRRDFVDINIIVFDESKVLHKNYVKDSIRSRTCDWEYSNSYSIFPVEGNENITFMTKGGEVVYNVMNNSF